MRACIITQDRLMKTNYCVNCIEKRKLKYRITIYTYHDIGAVVSVWLNKGEGLSAWFPTER